MGAKSCVGDSRHQENICAIMWQFATLNFSPGLIETPFLDVHAF
jgi:hypothetical protein